MSKNKPPHTLVVGGTRGIGRAVTEAFVESGHLVSVVGRSTGTGHWPMAVRLWRADLARTASLKTLVAGIFRANGPLHSVVFLQRFRGKGDDWRGELEVSLTATRVLIDLIQERFASHCSKAIVLVGSIAGQYVADEQSPAYHAAKAALRQLARYYACSLGPKGIRVNSVSPGVILKPEAEEFYRMNQPLVSLYERIAPLRRFGTAAEVAKVVRFLCGDDSSFVTGQDIVVDGGISLAWQASLARQLVPHSLDKSPRSRVSGRGGKSRS